LLENNWYTYWEAEYGIDSLKDSCSDPDGRDFQSTSGSELESDVSLVNFQSDSDSDGDLESDFADVDPQSNSDINLDCDVTSLGNSSNRNEEHMRKVRISVYGSKRQVLPRKKAHDRTNDDIARLMKQKIAQHKKSGPTSANHRRRVKGMIEVRKAYILE